ncbi:MAG: hypothetical protein ACI857_001645 [Arenicella sp.]|jgi:hypothetical protein
MERPTYPFSIRYTFLSFFLGIGLLFLLGYIDFEIITPILLPEDPCYFHIHKVPWWVDFFYMCAGCNGHPDGSIKHLLFLLIVSFAMGRFIAVKIRKFKAKKRAST